MRLVFRGRITSEERLALVMGTFHSARQRFGDWELIYCDNNSPKGYAVGACNQYGVKYYRCYGEAHTVNSLAHSLQLAGDKPLLCCVDDCIFSTQAKENIERAFNEYIPYLNSRCFNWGLFGFFCCYARKTVDEYKPIFSIPMDYVYALMAHIFHPRLSKAVRERWFSGPYRESYQDDLFAKREAEQLKMRYYNTVNDYVQHTGVNCSAIGHQGSNYQSSHFVP